VSHLADTSVLHRVARSDAVAERIRALRSSGSLWTCDAITLELGYSARNRHEWEMIVKAQQVLNQAPLEATQLARAREVQGELARKGKHRVKLPDLLIAASAEAARVMILHYDADFDTIGSVTGQPVEWVLPPGTID